MSDSPSALIQYESLPSPTANVFERNMNALVATFQESVEERNNFGFNTGAGSIFDQTVDNPNLFEFATNNSPPSLTSAASSLAIPYQPVGSKNSPNSAAALKEPSIDYIVGTFLDEIQTISGAELKNPSSFASINPLPPPIPFMPPQDFGQMQHFNFMGPKRFGHFAPPPYPMPMPMMPVAEGEKGYQCHFCPQQFSRSHDLKRHLTTHMANRPYVCSNCGKGFSRKDALQRHMKAIVEGKKEQCTKRRPYTRKQQFVINAPPPMPPHMVPFHNNGMFVPDNFNEFSL